MSLPFVLPPETFRQQRRAASHQREQRSFAPKAREEQASPPSYRSEYPDSPTPLMTEIRDAMDPSRDLRLPGYEASSIGKAAIGCPTPLYRFAFVRPRQPRPFQHRY